MPIDTSHIPNDHLQYALTWFFFIHNLGSDELSVCLDYKTKKAIKMKYISTRGLAPALTFEEAMLTGLALDGGLYVPEYIPKVTKNQILSMQGLRYQEIAFKITKPFMGNAFEDDELHEIIEKAYADFSHISCAPLVELEANHFLLELFMVPLLHLKTLRCS